MSWINDRFVERNRYIRSLPTVTLDGGQVMPGPTVRGSDRSDWYELQKYDKLAVETQTKVLKRQAEKPKSKVEQELALLEAEEERFKLSQMSSREQQLHLRRKELEAKQMTEKQTEKMHNSPEWKTLFSKVDKLLAIARQHDSDTECALAALRTTMLEDSAPNEHGMKNYSEFFQTQLSQLNSEAEAKHEAEMKTKSEATQKTLAETDALQQKFDELKGGLVGLNGETPS